jgi:hypothetical protein
MVKRHPTPRRGLFPLFPRSSSRRGGPLAACPDGIAVGQRRLNGAAPHPSGGAIAVETTMAKRPEGRLRPRNRSVPSDRPPPDGGGPVTVHP